MALFAIKGIPYSPLSFWGRDSEIFMALVWEDVYSSIVPHSMGVMVDLAMYCCKRSFEGVVGFWEAGSAREGEHE